MSTNIADLVWTATGGTTGRSNAARHADVINVKDWGVVGDGVTDDRAAIQALIDYVSAGLIVSGDRYCKAAIYFPPGDYRCNTSTTGSLGQGVLVVNWALSTSLRNFCLLGDSSATTRIFYDGTILTAAGKNTILLAFDNYVEGCLIQGLHFDMTPATGGARQATSNSADPMCIWSRGRQGRTGSKSNFVDMKLSGACFGMGVAGDGSQQGAECVFLFCKFEDCLYGFATFSENALDYTFIGGWAKNCIGGGILAVTGAICTLMGIEFSGNSGHTVSNPVTGNAIGDTASQNGSPLYVVGCNSTSLDHINYSASVYEACCYHHPSTSGGYFNTIGSDPHVLDANHSTNGVLSGNNQPVYLRGNTFGNANYRTAVVAPATVPEDI